MTDDIAIKVDNLSKCYHIYDQPQHRLLQMMFRGHKQFYREFWALKDVSFKVKKGETVGIIGRNGSGKSTLLQMICGTLNPTSGNIQTYGRIAALLELGSGFNPEFTGRENIYINASLLGLTYAQIEERFMEIVDFSDIAEFIDQPVKTYSSGMTLRLAFSVMAHVDADILVIDEALAVGDAFFTHKCMQFLRQFMKTGTVLFVSHDTGSIKGLCNRALWIEKGDLLQEGTPKEVSELYLEAFYETKQGKTSSTRLKPYKNVNSEIPIKDQRLQFINNSNLRNDLQVFQFDPEASSFGKGGAQIYDVALLADSGQPLAWIVGGERVTLRIRVNIYHNINSPIIGFYVKDRLGQSLFGDNTHLSYRDNPVSCKEGSILEANFVFNMPILPSGYYSIVTAVANGTQEDHEQHHWIHDAVIFKSESSSVATGLIGIPMLEIRIQNIKVDD